MQIRRQVSKTVKDYQNPKKNTQFSPSPIKRYQSSKSFIMAAPANTYTQDNKENLGFNGGSHSILSQNYSFSSTKRQRKPLQQVFNEMHHNSMNIVSKGGLGKESILECDEKNKSTKSVNLPIEIELTNHDNQQQNQPLNTDFKIMTHDSTLKKRRNDKYASKHQHQNLSDFDANQADLKDIQQLNIPNHSVQQHNEVEQSRKLNRQSSQLIKNPESESLMDVSFHSGNSQLNNASACGGGTASGMQYSGRWTDEEHEKFLEGLKIYGKDWRLIEEYIGSRTCAQIRSHAQKYFNKINRSLSKKSMKSERQTLGKRSNREGDDKKQDMVNPQPNKIQPPMNVPSSQLQSIPKSDNKFAPQTNMNNTQLNNQSLQIIQQQTKEQVSQIQENLQKLAEEEQNLVLSILIQQREKISFDSIIKRISPEDACKQMIQITNSFHEQAMKALKNNKFDICNRMVDERNLTQFICILLSKQVTVQPYKDTKNFELQPDQVIQHVTTSHSQESVDVNNETIHQTQLNFTAQKNKNSSIIQQQDQSTISKTPDMIKIQNPNIQNFINSMQQGNNFAQKLQPSFQQNLNASIFNSATSQSYNEISPFKNLLKTPMAISRSTPREDKLSEIKGDYIRSQIQNLIMSQRLNTQQSVFQNNTPAQAGFIYQAKSSIEMGGSPPYQLV